MSSFSKLFNRADVLGEARVSPYVAHHPSFNVTSKMRAGGLSSAPLDTIKFIRETLFYMDIITEDELNAIKKAPGFSGKKKAMLEVLAANQEKINQNSDAIAARIEETLDDFIGGMGVNRGREEKYAAQAAAEEMAKEMRKAKSGKEMDDALADVVNDESILIKASIAKILGEIDKNLGDEGFDIEAAALDNVAEFAKKISSLEQLKSFISQIQSEPGYEKIAAYLSSAVKPITSGLEDEEMTDIEDAEEHQSPYDGPSVVSNCCGAAPVGELDGNIGMCSDCKEMAEFAPIEDAEGAEEPLAKDTDDARDKGGKLYQGNRHGQYNKRTGKWVSNHERMLNRKSSKSEDEEGVDIWSLSPEQVSKLAEHMGQDESIQDITALIEYMAHDASPEEVEDMLGSEAKFLFGENEEDVVTESYTVDYMAEQSNKDKRNVKVVQESVSFKERFKPKTIEQLRELRRYGL